MIANLLARINTWAKTQENITGILLVGSFARGHAKPTSDIDIVIICDHKEKYIKDKGWLHEFGEVRDVKIEYYGKVTSLRVRYSHGIEVEFSITGLEWIAKPIDHGTRTVIGDGVKIVYDKAGDLKDIISYISQTNPSVKPVSATSISVQPLYTSCLVKTKDNKILLQHRGPGWLRFPNYVCTFGGKIERNETSEMAIVRELKEEIGAIVNTKSLIYLGCYTEAISEHLEVIAGYFWHDTENSITGCYEGEAIYISNIEELKNYSLVMDDVYWLTEQASLLNLI